MSQLTCRTARICWLTNDVSASFLSSQSWFRVTTPSSQSHLKFFRVESESWHGRVRVESQELSSHFESFVCQLESHEISRFCYNTFFAMIWHPTCHKMAPDKLENGAQHKHAMKWRPISQILMPNVVLTSLIAGYLYLSFLCLHFTYLFPSQSFQNSSLTLLHVLQPLN